MTRSWLIDRMAEWPEVPALHGPGGSTTYGELIRRIDRWHEDLDDGGLGRGRVVAIRGDYGLDTCALLLALLERQAIVVPLTDAVGPQIPEFLDVAEVEAVITCEAGRWDLSLRGVEASHELVAGLRAAGVPGLVLFSSGSTGRSKAVLHDLSKLLDKFTVPRKRFCTLTFLLMDHIGGVNTLFYTLSNGGAVVTVAERDPDTVCAAVERYRVQLLPTSPTFLNLLVISEAYARYDLSSLDLVTYGTEVMPESTLQRVHELLPDARLLQTYGLSELGILRSSSRGSDSLWVKVGGEGFETDVRDGILWVRAHSAMLGYLNAPSPFDADGWMNTGDEVEVDGEYIRILGRRSEIINVGGQKVYPAEVESVLLQLDNVKDVVVYGEPHAITGHIVAARVNLVEAEDARAFRQRARAHCRDRLASFKVPARFEVLDREQFNARYKRVRNQAAAAAASATS